MQISQTNRQLSKSALKHVENNMFQFLKCVLFHGVVYFPSWDLQKKTLHIQVHNKLTQRLHKNTYLFEPCVWL